MRYLVLMLLLLGCGPGPKSAKAAPPSKDTIVEMLEKKLEEHRTQSIERQKSTETKVDSLAETVGNNTAELEGVKEQLKGLKSVVEDLRKLLTLDAVPPVSVPQVPVAEKPEPPKAEPKPSPTLHGKPLDVSATIAANYKRMWTFPGSIDEHLAEHGVKGTEGLDHKTKRKLHSALHEMGLKPAKVAAKPPVVMNAAVVVPQSCPNGRCPNVQQYPYWQGYQQRNRLFGRAWR